MMRWVMLVSVLGVVSAACGDDGNTGHLADAPPAILDARAIDSAPDIDAAPGIDAPGIDAAPPAVTVTVTLGGVAAEGQTVYFQSHDSATTVTQATGADGNATGMVEAGGFVTVIKPEPPLAGVAIGNTSHLATFAGVQPGDHLYVDVPNPNATTTQISFDLSVPNEGLGYVYTLYPSCGAPQEIGRDVGQARNARRRARAIAPVPFTNTVTLVDCGISADLLIVGADTGGIVQSWQYHPDVRVADGVAIDLTDGYSAATNETFTYTVASGVSEVSFTRELRSAHGSIYTGSGQVFFDGNTMSSTTIALPGPPGLLAVTHSTVFATEGYSQHGVLAWGTADDYTLDYPATTLHPYTSSPGFDVATHALGWTEAPDGVAPSFAIGSFVASRVVNNVTHNWTWDLAAPYADGQPQLAYPVLPTELFDFNLQVGEVPGIQRLTTAKVAGGYDAARARVFAGDLAAEVAGASGQIVFQEWFSPRLGVGKILSTLRRLGFTPRAR